MGITDVSSALRKLDSDEKLRRKFYASDQLRSIWLLTEAGLYHLIFRSNKPRAREFQRWVCHEVIPSIRATGSYCLPNAQKENLSLLTASSDSETTLIRCLEQQLEDLKAEKEELKQINQKLEKEKFVAKYQLEDMVAKLILMDNSFTQKELQWEREKKELERYKVLYQKTHSENSWLKDQHNHTNNLTDSLSQSINELSKKKGFRRFQEDN